MEEGPENKRCVRSKSDSIKGLRNAISLVVKGDRLRKRKSGAATSL